MKKIIIGLTLAMGIGTMNVSAVHLDIGEYENNVGNGKPYTYEITEIDGNEIHGIPLDHVSFDNAGIFLYDDEIEFDTNVGDVIRIVWGQQEDEFYSIDLVE